MSTDKPRRMHWFPLDDSPESILYLMKYLPKYYNKIDCSLSTLSCNKVRNKIKRLKSIQNFNIKDHNLKGSSKKLIFLKSLSPTIRYAYIKDPRLLWIFPVLYKTTLDVYKLDSWRLFERSVKLRELNIDFINYLFTRNLKRGSSEINRYLSHRFWRHMKRLRNLYSLDIQISNEFNLATYTFLEKLNNSKEILKNLSRFSLFLNHANLTDGQKCPDLKNLFHKVTEIQLHELNCSILQHILDRLEQFDSLSVFKLIQNLQLPYASEPFKINFASLAKLKSINSLKQVDISINLSLNTCLESFLQNFSLPASVESVKFNFFDIRWKTVIPDIQNDKLDLCNQFQASDICKAFFNSWAGLEKLKSLSIAFTESEETPLSSLYFTIPILERITRLETLHYSQCYSTGSGKRKPLDFGYFWDKIKHLHTSLKCLYIETYAISLRKIQEALIHSNNTLEKIGLCGFVLGELQLDDFFDLFKTNSRENGKLSVELERVVIDKDENFPKFLEILKRVSKRIDLSIGVDVRKIKPEMFIKSLYEFYEGESFHKDRVQVCFYNVTEINDDEFCALCEMICRKDLFRIVRMLDRDEEELFNSEAAKEFHMIIEQDIKRFSNLSNQGNLDFNNPEESSHSNDMNGSDMDMDSDDMPGFLDDELSESLDEIEEDF